MTGPNCPYCSRGSELVTGAEVYRNPSPSLAVKMFWRCVGGCDAHVGCHPGTTNPLGRLANLELRIAKQRAHAAFDPLWKTRQKQGVRDARNRGYQWLASALSIDSKDCHIGMFDVDTCKRVVELCEPYRGKCNP